jgi:hypothetical protein
MQKDRNKLVNGFIITTFVGLYVIVSAISTIHVINFFELSNPRWLSISLAIAFEVGAAASLASLIILDKMNKFLVWSLFITLTCMQAMGNTYYAYINIDNFRSWSELFGLVEDDIIYQKRLLSIISGAILPLVSLGFIKSLVDYIKPNDPVEQISESVTVDPTQKQESSVQIADDLSQNLSTNPESEQPNTDGALYQEPLGEIVESINKRKMGYSSTDLDPTKIS